MMTASSTEAGKAAMAAHAAGINVVPPREDGSKAPLNHPEYGGWGHWKDHVITAGQVREWWADGYTGLGVVCGAISGNLEAPDFDDDATYEAFKERAAEVGLAELVERIENGYLDKTPKGYRWLWRCEQIGGSTKLAQRSNGRANVDTPIEVKGEAGYAITAPSNGTVHPTGMTYARLRGDFDTIVTVSPDERDSIFEVARSFDEMPIKEFAPSSNSAKSVDINRPGDHFNRDAKWEDVLTPHGWVMVSASDVETFWRRPGKEAGISATTNFADSDLLYVFTTSTALPLKQGLSRFAAYTFLNHEGDFGKAAADLARQGFGGPAEASNSSASADFDRMANSAGVLATQFHSHANDRLVHKFEARERGWFYFDGIRWQEDINGLRFKYFDEFRTEAYREAADLEKSARSARLKYLDRFNDHRAATRILDRAKSLFTRRAIDFDAEPMMLGTDSGSINLSNGKLLTDPELLTTKSTGYAFDPKATCPNWLMFLNQIFQGDEELTEFIQRLFGYCLTGRTGKSLFIILYGLGANGKSTQMQTHEWLLGDYAHHADASLFGATGRAQPESHQLADLMGARVVSSVEFGSGRRLAEGVIKNMTGGDRITAAKKYQDQITFTPVFVPILATNHKPTIVGASEGIWRRIALVPFEYEIPSEELDEQFFERKLKPELAGILNWAIEGLNQVIADGGTLALPEAVRAVTDEYRSGEDLLAEFIAGYCIVDREASESLKALYAAYKDHFGEDDRPLGRKQFSSALEDRGWPTRPGAKNVRYVHGIRLVDTNNE